EFNGSGITFPLSTTIPSLISVMQARMPVFPSTVTRHSKQWPMLQYMPLGLPLFSCTRSCRTPCASRADAMVSPWYPLYRSPSNVKEISSRFSRSSSIGCRCIRLSFIICPASQYIQRGRSYRRLNLQRDIIPQLLPGNLFQYCIHSGTAYAPAAIAHTRSRTQLNFPGGTFIGIEGFLNIF